MGKTRHHIVFRSHGKVAYTEENEVALCYYHHDLVHTQRIQYWINRLKELVAIRNQNKKRISTHI